MDYTVIEEENYGGIFKRKWNGRSDRCPCYTKRQWAALHPKNKPMAAAGYANHFSTQGKPENYTVWNACQIPVYPIKQFSLLRYKVCGYVHCEGDGVYLALYRSRLPYYLLYLLALLSCLSIAAVLVHTYRPPETALPIDPNAVEFQGKEQPHDPGKLTFESITNLEVPAEKTTAQVTLHNPKSNQGYCVASLWVQQKDGNWSELYQSQWIAPGHAIYQISLNYPLPKGSYPAYVKYTAFSDKREPMNSVVFHITLKAK